MVHLLHNMSALIRSTLMLAGVECLVTGIVGAHAGDEARQEEGSVVFENLYQYFRRKQE